MLRKIIPFLVLTHINRKKKKNYTCKAINKQRSKGKEKTQLALARPPEYARHQVLDWPLSKLCELKFSEEKN